MQSRISFFDKTIFKKNLTRFAPCWGLYTIGLLMALVTLIGSGSRWFSTNVCDFIHILCAITPCYALLCAQLLFGDLYSARMCNALHALPLRRETWFCTHVLSGVLFSLVPVGYATNVMGGAGGPLAVLIVAIVAAEFGKAVSKETKIDILVTPIVTILIGVGLSCLIAKPISTAASYVGTLIMMATELQPFWMGIAVSVLVGIALTLPISSAAICAAEGSAPSPPSKRVR